MGTALEPIQLPDWAWERAEVRQALRARDIGAVFRHAQQYAGASQTRIATATGMTQARVSEIISGRREVSRLDVYERIADGLHMPDDARHLLGLAAGRERRTAGSHSTWRRSPKSSACTPRRTPQPRRSSSRPAKPLSWTCSPCAASG
ncbi:helix-turn-helix transcriptional regulator [Streptomyces sp. TRM70350]|uniref:helix-turn-helix domain-containing protein n=1 Tax=Streptomyces sp. TRM70350 TaxID=2856165 RepID=UPI0027E00D69|nr:helix-turn-helix transcriptional regulator [Streptomyces sp. TRM70350]